DWPDCQLARWQVDPLTHKSTFTMKGKSTFTMKGIISGRLASLPDGKWASLHVSQHGPPECVCERQGKGGTLFLANLLYLF
ncbi:hypothetical protein AVEN_154066-1, partial [Araneus ventricosus]